MVGVERQDAEQFIAMALDRRQLWLVSVDTIVGKGTNESGINLVAMFGSVSERARAVANEGAATQA